MVLTVVIPVYNERHTCEEILRRVCGVDIPKQIIVVDDASTDGTREILMSIESDLDRWTGQYPGNSFVFIYQPKNCGKGAALRAGFGRATGDYVVVQDADFEYDPREYGLLLRPLLDGRADVVFSSRFLGGQLHRVLYFWHYAGNKFLTLLSNMFTNLNLTDMEACYKMFRREILQSIVIEEDRFGFEPEVVSKAARLGCRIYEVGISYSGRSYEEGKKIGWKDGIRAIYCILKYGFFARSKKASTLSHQGRS